MSSNFRKYFDLAGAADFLSCHHSDISYYIKEDRLRLAFKSNHADLVILNDSLPQQAQSALSWIEADFPEAKLSPKEASKAELLSGEWAYFKWSSVERDVPVSYPFGVWDLEDFNGRPVSIWIVSGDELQLTFEWFTEEAAKNWPLNCVLTREELERFSGKPQAVSSIPFNLPNKPDEVAEAIVTFGNRFFSELGHVPTSKELQGYMM